MNLTRRSFLSAVGVSIAAAPLSAARPRFAAPLPHPRGGRLGLELYSVRNELKKDLAGTLKMVREWGFEDVELAGFPPMSADDTARALRAAGLRAVSQFVEYDKFRDAFPSVAKDAKTLGVEELIVGWIPHEKVLTAEDVDRAVRDFNTWGAAAAREQLRLGYHIHGYEFVGGADGTMLDRLFRGTDPQHVDFEMDVFWVVRGGGDPVALLTRYGRRIRLVHLKDLSRSTETGVTTGAAPDEASVTLGTGTIRWTKVLEAAQQAQVKWYFLEDEHPDAVKQIPQSLDYLRKTVKT
ncbi:MAG: sugar phosphate isomerase/epimerase [Acidobacteria bacterium]|nr:sugar phosphate isomerase/epimerase [Acidobacteriota bacterium]